MKDLLEKLRPVFNAEGGGDGGGAPDASASAGGGTVLGTDTASADANASGNDLADSMYPGDDKKVVEPPKNEGDDTKPPAEETEDKPKEGEEDKGKEKEKKGDEAPPLKAEDITFDLPDGFELDGEVADEFKTFAVDNGLTLDQVKSLQAMQAKLYEKQTSAHAETVAKWGADLKADKEIGGKAYEENIGYAKAAVQEFFSAEGLRMLDVTGLGNHPDIVKGFVRMGKTIGEGRTHKGTGSKSQTSIVDAMYGEG